MATAEGECWLSNRDGGCGHFVRKIFSHECDSVLVDFLIHEIPSERPGGGPDVTGSRGVERLRSMYRGFWGGARASSSRGGRWLAAALRAEPLPALWMMRTGKSFTEKLASGTYGG